MNELRASDEGEGAALRDPPAFPVVGIGASAGGLAAFEALLSGMPTEIDCGMAFVLVQHLAPDHQSLLTELIKRHTSMEVSEAADGVTVNPNCAYVIPPDRDLSLVDGTLRVSSPELPRGHRLPVDFFFRSLARDRRDHAMGIVLSGTGHDGSEGIRAIKEAGGLTMAQSPESAERDGMPRSAVATGMVDHVLAPEEMAVVLLAHRARLARRDPGPPALPDEGPMREILTVLLSHTGHDFSDYKRNTISRRIARRMAVQKSETLESYLRLLRDNPAEADALFSELLIGVTSFFRDHETFEILARQLVPSLVTNRPTVPLRVWVPACSTGEEAYSLAILLKERLDELEMKREVQIFATDVDGRAIEAARLGIYPASIADHVSPERLEKHFVRLEDGRYRVTKGLRELLIFSEQNVVRDPPLSRMDLIGCRNLLIYLGAELQKRLIRLFHYALNPSGVLFLGSSESIGDLSDLFVSLDRNAKLFRRLPDAPGTPHAHSPRRMVASDGYVRPLAARRSDAPGKPPLRLLVEQALLEDGPVAALVDAQGDLAYLHGRSGDFLELAPGDVGINIVRMAREGLRNVLSQALRTCVSQRAKVFHPGVQVASGSHVSVINLGVRPVSAPEGSSGPGDFYLVTFERVHEQAPRDQPLEASSEASEAVSPGTTFEERLRVLEKALEQKDEFLRSAQEEMQAANLDLMSANEELQATNEELQSSNEELETSKEELQSMNEELTTVNAELQSKMIDVSRLNNDMLNLLAGTGIGMILLDHNLRIQRFTTAAVEFINLIPTDVGRPIGHIVSNLVGYTRLVEDVQSVLDTLETRKIDVRTRGGAWFLLVIRPYRTSENVIEGAIITFTDITALKEAEARLPGASD